MLQINNNVHLFIFIFRFGISLKPHKSPLKQQKLNVSIFSNFHQNQMYAKRLFGLTCSEICKCSANVLSLYDVFCRCHFAAVVESVVQNLLSVDIRVELKIRFICDESSRNKITLWRRQKASCLAMEWKKKTKYGRCHKMWIVSLDARNTVDISLNVKPAKNMLISSKQPKNRMRMEE